MEKLRTEELLHSLFCSKNTVTLTNKGEESEQAMQYSFG
jgi:hypothetical protein